MNCVLRKWRLSDAADLAAALNNEKILNNMRDGLPFPYTEQEAHDYIITMLSSDETSTFAYAITQNDRAIGKKLFEAMRRDYAHQVFTVHSSPYAVEGYRHLGFVPTDKEQAVDGLRFTLMQYSTKADEEDVK